MCFHTAKHRYSATLTGALEHLWTEILYFPVFRYTATDCSEQWRYVGVLLCHSYNITRRYLTPNRIDSGTAVTRAAVQRDKVLFQQLTYHQRLQNSALLSHLHDVITYLQNLTAPQIRLHPFPSTSLPIHNSIFTLAFEIQKASLNTPQMHKTRHYCLISQAHALTFCLQVSMKQWVKRWRYQLRPPDTSRTWAWSRVQ